MGGVEIERWLQPLDNDPTPQRSSDLSELVNILTADSLHDTAWLTSNFDHSLSRII